jgi:DNA helicase-2/ATP-dependent DNA helicase PcrA
MNLLENLNEAQRAAVVNYDCPSLIVAGAGSGKTRVLTSRIAYMLQQGVEPWRILALTFTHTAAAEMRERIGRMVGEEQSRRLWMGTFHSIFLRILRLEADKICYPSSFTIYDTADSRNLIKHIVKEKNLPDDVYKPAAVQARISLAKNNLVTAQAYAANETFALEDRERKQPAFADIYKEYARRCRQNGAMDFDDMLLNINILFKDHADVLERWQQRFEYILVDEYQDTNYAQYIIIRRLAQHHSRVCVVGDDSQSIYSFRGAKIENILRFKNDFPAAQTFKLEQNYRSTQTIVGAANSVIERNANRLPKESFSSEGEGEKIKIIKAYTDKEEASLVADEVRRRVRGGGAGWGDVAILYRTNAQSRAFEESLRRRGIPYRIYGGMSFYQRKEVKDVLAYMHLIVNPRDDEAMRRVINYPARGIGDVTIAKLAEAATARGIGLFEAAREGVAEVNAGTLKRLKDFTELIDGLSVQRDEMPLYEFGLEVATRSGIIGTYRIENSPEAQSALDNIEELLNSMRTFVPEEAEDGAVPTLTDWLQSITLLTDQDEDNSGDRVTLMTIHAAKGLEYKFVFIVGMEEQLFPSQRSVNSGEDLEEERRLFYVALTRAKEAVALSHCGSRFKWGSVEPCSPSRFLKEIDAKFLEEEEEKEPTADSPFSGRSQRWTNERRESTPAPGGSAARDDSHRTQPVLSPSHRPLTKIVARPGHAHTLADSGNYAVGQRVAHAKFGIGTITEIEQMAGDTKISVTFDTGGPRTLLAKFAKLAIVG